MASTKQRDIMDSNPRTGNSDKLPKINELFNQISLGKDFKQLRLVGGFASYATHWIEIKGAKTGKEAKIPRICLNYNSEQDVSEDNGCPYCKIGNKTQVKYLFNVIDRDEQEDLGKKEPKYNKSEIKKGVLEAGSKAKSPIFVLQLPPGQVDRLKKYSKLNKVKDKKKGNIEASVTDIKYGIDLNFSFDPEAKGNNYDIQKADRTPLTDKEQKLLLWDIESIIKIFAPKSLDEAKKDFKELKKLMTDAPDSDDDYSKDDSKKSKGKKSKKDDSDISDSDASDKSDSDASDSDSDSDKKKKSKGKKAKKDVSESSDSDASDSDLGSDVDSDTSDSDSDSDKKSKKSKGKKSKKDDSDSDASDSDSSDNSDASDSDASDSDASESDSDKKKSKKGKKSKKDDSDSDASEVDSDSDDSDSDSSSKKSKGKKDSKKSSKKKKK